jgi:organic hydroperoxide reductase OsmC/OhrA
MTLDTNRTPMKSLPHTYHASAANEATGSVIVSSPGLPDLETAPPAEFGGPGDLWSPETLLCAAITDCFNLTFRALARASKLEWKHLESTVEAELTRQDHSTSFTSIRVHARLQIPSSDDSERAQRLLEKAESSCLITASLRAPSHLIAEVVVA